MRIFGADGNYVYMTFLSVNGGKRPPRIWIGREMFAESNTA